MTKQNTYILRIVTMLLIMMVMGVGSAWAQTHTEQYDYDDDGVPETYNVVYLNLSSGNNAKDGASVANAVKDWKTAYSKLPAYTGTTDADRDAAWDKNIIVVCDASNNQLNTVKDVTNKVPATITGVWPWTADNTTAAKVKGGGAVYVNTGNDTSGPSLGMDTKFKYLRFRSQKVGSEAGSSYLQCYLHDVTFDVGCVMDIAADLIVDNGLTKGNKAPDLHLMMYANTHNFTNTTDGGWPAQTKPMVLTIKSGKIGRLLSCRITGTSSSDTSIKNRYVVGNPSHPLTAILNLDIDPNTSEGDWNSKGYTNDIEFCCAGATQGIEYCDIKFNIKRGKIGTLVSACQGMSITQTKNLGLSNSSFFGRTEVNLIPNNSDDDITINRYYGACLGRSQSSPSSTTNGIANTAFYGRSTLNMYGGRINNGVFISAGGVSGLQSTDGRYHTCDQYIPYLDNSSAYSNYPYMGIKYQPYNSSLTIAKVTTIMNGTPEVIDLAETVTTMNIYGGEIKGGIYGGSYGYSDVLRIQCAMEQAGSLWGDTHVNIYGGKISGGVYGGGQGSADFYNLAPTNRKNEFTTVASVYGNTNVNIYGGEIDGDIYGGGMGLNSQAAGSGSVISFDTPTAVTLVANEFLNIAKVYGNTNVLIDPKILKPYKEWAVPNVPEFTGPNEGWAFTGNIYGGGALGAVEGATNVIIKGGNITGNVFGGGLGEDGHTDKAKVIGNTEANILGGIQGDEYAVYGGAQMALVDGNTGVILQGGTVGNAYGGGLGTNTMAANVTGDATVQLGSDDGTTSSKVLGSIYGANNLNGTPQGHAKVHVLKTTPRDGQTSGQYDVAAVYGGGNLAAYVPTDGNDFAEVLIENCDNSIEYVYGGGNAAPVPATKVTIKGANAIDNAFAGGNGAGADNPGADIGYKGFFSSGAATEYGTGIATINVQGGTIHHVYGGSNTLGYIKDHAVVNVEADGSCEMNVAELYGGGKKAPGKAAQINITCTGEGKIDNVYGGAHMADLTGDITLNINGGNIGNAFGGNNESGTINGAITVNVNWNTEACGTNSLNNVYGGGNLAPYTTPDGMAGPTVNLINGTVTQSIFGGGYGVGAVVTGNPEVNVTGGSAANIYGGGALADVLGNTSVVISGGASGDVYGGGLGSAEVAASVGNTSVSVTGGTANNVFGCNNTNGAPTGTVNIEIAGGTVKNNVYGGGNLASATVNPIVTVSGGTVIHDVYGGGALADVTGNTTVNLTGGAVGGAYGGALGSAEVAAKVYGDTYVHLDGSKVTETGIFGANNLNGTPTGHVKVHVTSTTPRDGFAYDVPAVYGGGNLSAYQPSDENDFAEVLIENCDNSIEYVYGGGNAAPVPATRVTIYGAKAINHAFAGGNGAGQSTDPHAANYNPGADVGYLDFTRDDTHAYGTGKASITVYGGTVHNVYGGSNTLGFIRGGTSVSVANEDGACPLNVGNVFGGGNEADINCDVTMDLDCSEGGTILYAGANNADVNGSITLNIHSGTYGKVFCGNNTGGAVKGKLTVNVDETGCWPIMIGELYGGGNQAGYSVYGYEVDDDGNVVVKTEGNRLYGDPEVNLYSFTRIGKVFGGGYGETAVLYGNTHVNVEPIPGIYSDGTATPAFVLNQDDERVRNDANSTVLEVLGAEKIGSIGTIYGGGNAGAVYGHTDVKIGTKATNKHISGNDTTTAEDVTVTITGSVFGGGNEAIVSGNTNVTIGK